MIANLFFLPAPVVVGAVVGGALGAILVGYLTRPRSVDSLAAATVVTTVGISGGVTIIVAEGFQLGRQPYSWIIAGYAIGAVVASRRVTSYRAVIRPTSRGSAWQPSPPLPVKSAVAGAASIVALAIGGLNGVFLAVLAAALAVLGPFVIGEIAGRLLPSGTTHTVTELQYYVLLTTGFVVLVPSPYISRWIYLYTYGPRTVMYGLGVAVGMLFVIGTVLPSLLAIRHRVRLYRIFTTAAVVTVSYLRQGGQWFWKRCEQYVLLRP